MERVLIAGEWRQAQAARTFQAQNPATRESMPEEFPVSSWADCERALAAASEAAEALREGLGKGMEAQLAAFLSAYADRIEDRADEIVAMAHMETALPESPRLRNVELPRTTTQLRQAAAAAFEGSWMQPVIDTKLNIRSCFAPIGPVVVMGPNNFPFAYNGIAGGDFAAAIATGCPVIAKSHPLHPHTSKLLAECAYEALAGTGLPMATVQMLFHVEAADGLRLVADKRVGATAFTGSRAAGLALKEAADKAGRAIYLEMSSLNPVVLLPGALTERVGELAVEISDSGLAGVGQFCTSPNLLFVIAGDDATRFVEELTTLYGQQSPGTLLSAGGLEYLQKTVGALVGAGARVLTGGEVEQGAAGVCFRNTVLQVGGREFVASEGVLQQEAFGNSTMVVVCADADELLQALPALEGNLTASIYSAWADASDGSEEELYMRVAAVLRPRCGRLLNDKVPTGVAVSPAMQHGGPYPSTGHPGFTAVGMPRSLQRFGALQCYDNVRADRLPAALRDEAPQGMWRVVDGSWLRG